MYRKSILILVVFLSQTIIAQKPENLLEKWAIHSPIEKIYLHTDRDNYVAGETVFFHAYLSSEWQPDTISTSVYAALMSEKKIPGTEKVFPVFAGGANGQLYIPDTLSTGWYTIRAYTATMISTAPGFICNKAVFIYGKKKNNTTTSMQQPGITLSFFPEGGNMVNNLSCAVAFKATDENGMPAAVFGKIKNSKGIEITTFSSYHDGMGLFELKPEAGEKYFAEIDGKDMRTGLPEALSKGIAVALIPQNGGYFFEVQQHTADPSFTVSYIIGQMQHHFVFRQQLSSEKSSIQGTISTKNLSSGILQVTFFNKEGMPLAERLCFVNNCEYVVPALLHTDTLNFSAREKNRFSIGLNDTVTGSISVSVTDADYLLADKRNENIYSGLLLTSDIKGYVHNPSWYFTAAKDSADAGMDLLMMTNGWRRFRWTELVTKKEPVVKDGDYITLSGRIFSKGTKRPFAEKKILLMVAGPATQKNRSTYMVETGKDGSFKIDSLLFFGRNRLLFLDIRGKKSQYIDVELTGDSLCRTFLLPLAEKNPSAVLNNQVKNKRWQEDFDAIMKASGITLEEVKVTAKKKNAVELLDENYTSGVFSGTAFTEKVIDLVNTNETVVQDNIFEYLKSRVPGIQVLDPDYSAGRPSENPRYDTDKYRVYYRQMPSLSAMGNPPMTLYLDEIETDANVIATLSASEIAMIKVYSSFAAAEGGGAGGALAIYTKKGEDRKSIASFSNLQLYDGYSVIKEFYAPDYRERKPVDKPDNRITIDWRPSIFVNAINPRIPFSFYNNDRTKSFKVVVEGMTTSGKLIWLEKIIK